MLHDAADLRAVFGLIRKQCYRDTEPPSDVIVTMLEALANGEVRVDIDTYECLQIGVSHFIAAPECMDGGSAGAVDRAIPSALLLASSVTAEPFFGGDWAICALTLLARWATQADHEMLLETLLFLQDIRTRRHPAASVTQEQLEAVESVLLACLAARGVESLSWFIKETVGYRNAYAEGHAVRVLQPVAAAIATQVRRWSVALDGVQRMPVESPPS